MVVGSVHLMNSEGTTFNVREVEGNQNVYVFHIFCQLHSIAICGPDVNFPFDGTMSWVSSDISLIKYQL